MSMNSTILEDLPKKIMKKHLRTVFPRKENLNYPMIRKQSPMIIREKNYSQV